MATKTKAETIEEAKSLGIAFDQASTQKQIQEQIDAIERDGNNEPILSSDQQKRQSEYIEKKLEDDMEKKRLDRETSGTPAQEAKGDEPRKYTEEQMRDIVKKMAAELGIKPADDDLDEDAFSRKKIRLPRYNGKFVVGFNNMNKDEFFPELVVQAFDVWDEQEKRMKAWVNLKFLNEEDGQNVPLYSAITRSIKVECDLVDIKKVPLKIDNGRTEILGDEKDYSRKGTGSFTKMRVTQDETKFLVRIPGTGQEVLVGPEVVNW